MYWQIIFLVYNNSKVAQMQQKEKGGIKVINSSKIRGRIVEKGKTIQEIAPKVPCSAYTLGQKIANEAPMNLSEVEVLINELDIKENEFAEFFLN